MGLVQKGLPPIETLAFTIGVTTNNFFGVVISHIGTLPTPSVQIISSYFLFEIGSDFLNIGLVVDVRQVIFVLRFLTEWVGDVNCL